jgi:hypothetical protein
MGLAAESIGCPRACNFLIFSLQKNASKQARVNSENWDDSTMAGDGFTLGFSNNRLIPMHVAERNTGFCALALFAFLLTACTTLTRHGDAILYDKPNIVFAYVDPLEFPKSSLAQTATFSYQVLDLPQEIYPSGFLLEIPQNEDAKWLHNQPWRNCVIRASLLTLKDDLFFTKKIDFSKDWNGNSQPGSDSDHRKIWFAFTDYDFNKNESSLPRNLSYVLRIEVIKPSLRSSDQLEIEAETLLPHTKRFMSGERQ